MKNHSRRRLLAAGVSFTFAFCLLTVYLIGTVSAAQASTTNAGSSGFSTFRAQLNDMKFGQFASFASHGGVKNAQSFAQMRSYLQRFYRGVRVVSSQVIEGETFDCVIEATQPSARSLGIRNIAAPSPTPAVLGHEPTNAGMAEPTGSSEPCPAGSIPLKRITLQKVAQFPYLADFLRGGTPHAQSGADPTTVPCSSPSTNDHRYAHACEDVDNLGGNSWINTWNPSANFSISQQWYSGGSGAHLQTVEGGWIKYPALFGLKSAFFIFSTPNDYASGCYNLLCAGFVQTNASFHLGAPFSNYSTVGGKQWGFSEQWRLSAGKWWLYFNSASVGYYPVSYYSGGQLASKATGIDYGGETAFDVRYGAMGSGQFASVGPHHPAQSSGGKAAFQDNIFYISSANKSIWASLLPYQFASSCYTIRYTPSTRAVPKSVGTSFYFGGPGGASCPD